MFSKRNVLVICLFVFCFVLGFPKIKLVNSQGPQCPPTFTVTEYPDSITVENAYTKWVVRNLGAVITKWWIKSTNHNQSSDVCPEYDGHKYMLLAAYWWPYTDFRNMVFNRQIIHQTDSVVVIWTASGNYGFGTLERIMIWQSSNFLKVREKFINNNSSDSILFRTESAVKVGGNDQNDLVAFKYVGQDSIDTSYTNPFPNTGLIVSKSGNVHWLCAYDRIAGEYVGIVPISGRIGFGFGDEADQNPEGNGIFLDFGYVKPGDSLTVSYYLSAGIGDFNKVYLPGDVNDDGRVTVADVVFLINYLFKNGPSPKILESADVNLDGNVSVSDVIYLISYLFKNGPCPLPACI